MSVSMLPPQRILQAALTPAHDVLEATMADIDDELANRPAPGVANPIGSSYAHAALTEDAILNGWLQGKQPLWSSAWTGRTGTDGPMPWEGLVPGDIGEWYHSVRIDLAACRAYAKVVYAQSEAFLAASDDAMLAREVRTPAGAMPLAVAFVTLVVAHCNQLAGEISAIKGAFGLRGYPF
jgi:DinB superfamily